MSIVKSKKQRESRITRAQVLRTIEQLKASGKKVWPDTVAEALEVSSNFFYTNFELLDVVYRYGSPQDGADSVIQQLVAEIKSDKRKINKLEKSLNELEKKIQTSYGQGFSDAASISFTNEKKNLPVFNAESVNIEEELLKAWSLGVLSLDYAKLPSLKAESLRSAYRKLILCLHPDKVGSEGNEFIQRLNQAYKLLSQQIV